MLLPSTISLSLKLRFAITCVVLAGSTCCPAQGVKYRHAVSTTVSLLRIGYTKEGNGVPGGIFLVYDYMFRHSARGFWSAQAGIGAFGFKDYYHGYSIPTVLGYNWGKKTRFFQFGIAGHYINEYFDSGGATRGPHRDQSYFLGPQLGYKRIRPKGYYFGAYLGFIAPIVTTYEPPPSFGIGGTEYTGSTLVGHVSIAFGWAFGKRE